MAKTKANTRKTATKAKASDFQRKSAPAVGKKATAQRAKPKSSVKKTAQAKAKPKTTKAKASKASVRAPAIRRPDSNQPPDKYTIEGMTNTILNLIDALNFYAANLRALDRARHNGVGIKRLGFIEAALRLSTKFPQYLPHWLTTQKFKADLDLFNAVRSLVEVCRSLEEKAWNINVEASDMVYTDALEYYAQVKDAAERRIDSAESIRNELYDFFKNHGPSSAEGKAPTKKKQKRDANALIDGRKDGKMLIENNGGKTTAGKREIIDETYKRSAAFKETDEGTINE